jgi:hypothetical protein
MTLSQGMSPQPSLKEDYHGSVFGLKPYTRRYLFGWRFSYASLPWHSVSGTCPEWSLTMNPRNFLQPLSIRKLDFASTSTGGGTSAKERFSDREEGACQTDIANCKVTGLVRRGIFFE